MPRFTSIPRLLALVVAVIVSTLAWSTPTHADDPVTTRTSLSALGGYLEEETEVTLSAQVLAAVRPVSGSVTFSDDEGHVLGEVPVTAYATGNALANLVVPKPTRTTTYVAEFYGTNGYADSSDTVQYTPRSIRTVTVAPEPTLLKLGGGLLPQLTLTLAATAKLKDGTGVPGIRVNFSALCPPGPSRNCSLSIPLCSAVTDANGFASCRGSGTLGAVLSILQGLVTMTTYQQQPAPETFNLVGPTQFPPLIG